MRHRVFVVGNPDFLEGLTERETREIFLDLFAIVAESTCHISKGMLINRKKLQTTCACTVKEQYCWEAAFHMHNIWIATRIIVAKMEGISGLSAREAELKTRRMDMKAVSRNQIFGNDIESVGILLGQLNLLRGRAGIISLLSMIVIFLLQYSAFLTATITFFFRFPLFGTVFLIFHHVFHHPNRAATFFLAPKS